MTAAWRVGYYPTIMSGPVARFRRDDIDGEIAAGREGVTTREGAPGALRTALDDDSLADVLAAALRVAEALARPPTDAFAAIQAALGDGWTLERPALFARRADTP